MENLHLIVEKAKSGDGEAIESLITEFQGMAISYAWSLVGDFHLAEDLAQEAFIQALRSIGSLINPHAFPAWFITILRFTCIRYLRKHQDKTLPLDEIAYRDESKDSIDEILIQKETADLIWESIRKFNEVDRNILVLYHFENMSYQEIAVFLNVTESKITNRLHAMRNKLKKESLSFAKQLLHDEEYEMVA
jgi:RNA polymerase sigma factor (sigma-70 family)